MQISKIKNIIGNNTNCNKKSGGITIKKNENIIKYRYFRNLKFNRKSSENIFNIDNNKNIIGINIIIK